jgi:type IV pilus assembly protein PilC
LILEFILASYFYTARSKGGEVSKGSLFANDRAAAINDLLKKGLTPILLTESKPAAAKGLSIPFLNKVKLSGKVKLNDKVIFSRQFSTMINAGVPITKALGILKGQTSSKTFSSAIGDLETRVEGGSTLANALAAHPTIFSPVYINMVRAGETGGILDEILERLAEQQEKDAEIIGKVRGAMIYPGVVTTVTIGAFFFLMTVIVPKLGTIFEGLGAELPIYTKVLLLISHFMVKFAFLIGIALVVGVIAFMRFIKTNSGKRMLDNILIRLPLFGPIIKKVNVARFARTFGSLMSSGIAVLDALNATSTAINNTIYKDALTEIAKQVKNGRPISEGVNQNKHFPAIVGQMISVGEETGELDQILLKLATFYEKEVDTIVSSMTSVIEPILIMVIGTMVGFIVISVFGPLAALNNAV